MRFQELFQHCYRRCSGGQALAQQPPRLNQVGTSHTLAIGTSSHPAAPTPLLHLRCTRGAALFVSF